MPGADPGWSTRIAAGAQGGGEDGYPAAAFQAAPMSQAASAGSMAIDRALRQVTAGFY